MLALLLWTLQPLLWTLSSLLTGALLFVGLTCAWRAYRMSARLEPVDAAQTVLVTGASSGIGLALSKHLVGRGFSVAASYYDPAEPGCAELRRLGQRLETENRRQRLILLELDVRKEESVARARQQLEAQLERHRLHLWAVVNNAGLGALLPFAWMQRQRMRAIVETNLLGAMLVAREFLPLLARTEGARLVNVSSPLGLLPGAHYALYGASKAGLSFLTSVLRVELAELRVRAVTLLPHNLVRLTNIGRDSLRVAEASWAELGAPERRLYAASHARHLETLRRAEARPAPAPGPPSALARALAPLTRTLRLLAGRNDEASLEQSGLLQRFEEALRMRHPPEHIFAGSALYNLLVGAVFVSLPPSCAHLLGALVSKALHAG